MATIYAWQINQLETAPQLNGLPDVVTTVHWTRLANDGTYTVSSYGTMTCTTPSETDFTAYTDLTEAQVCIWLEDGLDVETIDKGLDAQIENLINPPIVILPLPWNEPTPVIEPSAPIQQIGE